MTDFMTFMRERDQAALAYCQGDAAPVNALTTEHGPASFFGPDGHAVQGPEEIKAAFSKGAMAFGVNGNSHLEIVQSGSEGEIAYWCGFQYAEVDMDGKMVPMSLRITELFRREAGAWKLVHRHADMAKAA
ncbi:YybH family protein [Mesorhizobium sp. NPDC059054]|uniref:YybH family protein n=1 Tax=unclassified Mesorhizobium TaxID=325217 RepID=UPI0006C76DBC|nr:nuclear transport factor 2 family protein [Mesorhizobium sp. 1M-11]